MEKLEAGLLDNPLSAGATVCNVDSTTDFLQKVVGPDLVTINSALRTYIRIEDEIIEYETLSGTQFQTLTRGALGTTATSHALNTKVYSLIRLNGNILNDIALNLMISGNGNYIDGLSVSNFNRITVADVKANTIVFQDLDLVSAYNVQVGDYVTTTGSAIGANNVTAKAITGITKNSYGTYLDIAGVTFTEEIGSSATIQIRSKYDVWPAGFKMSPNEVDITEYNLKFQQFMSSFNMDFYLQDAIDGKDFISSMLNAASMFSIPRKAQSSVGLHIGPLPTADIKILDSTNVTNASKTGTDRSVTKNFYNSVVYAWDKNPIPDQNTYLKDT